MFLKSVIVGAALAFFYSALHALISSIIKDIKELIRLHKEDKETEL